MKRVSALPFAMFAALAACSQTLDTTGPVLDESPRWANVGKSCDDSAPAVLLSAARRDSLPAEYLGPPDRKWADLARTAPGGIGGIYQTGPNLTGEYFVLLTDPTKKAEAFAAISAAFPGIENAFPLERAQVVEGRWDFAELGDWYGYLMIKQPPGVTSSDIDEKGNRLDFGVPDEQTRATLEAWLTALDVPCRLVAIHIQPPVKLA